MPPAADSSPAASPIDEARQVVVGLLDAWSERYGDVVCTVHVTASSPAEVSDVAAAPVATLPSAPRPGGAEESHGPVGEPPALRLEGEVLVQAQREALLAALRSRGWVLEDAIRVLSDPAVDSGLGWVAAGADQLELRSAPVGGALATEWLAGDPPLRVLARRASHLAVQAADGTVGWVPTAAVVHLPPEASQRAADWREAFAGRWVEPPAGAWRKAVAAWSGTPYRWGGASRRGADCSGYLQRLVREVAGLGLPKHSADQARCGRRVAPAEAAPGDLLYLTHRERRIAHVALLVEAEEGQAWVTHANLDGAGVCLEPLAGLLERYALRGVRRLGPSSAALPRRASAAGAQGPGTAAAGDAGAASVYGCLDLPLQRNPAAGWDWLRDLVGRRIHVVGYTGAEGAAVAAFLWQQGCRDLVLHDLSEPSGAPAAFAAAHVGLGKHERAQRWAELASLPVKRCHGADYLSGIGPADEVFVGQAWYLYPRNLAVLDPMVAAGRPLVGLMDLYFRLCGAPIVAVSGSNGKSTTSRWIEHILRRPGADPRLGKIYFAGNDRHGVQVAGALPAMTAADRLVLEVSNRHLRGMAPRPELGVLTNILPNHLEEHGGSLAAYQAAKARLLQGQDARGLAVWNQDDPLSREIARDLPGQSFPFSLEGPVARGAWLAEERLWLRLEEGGPGLPLLHRSALALPGAHNLANALAAALAAALAGATLRQLRQGLSDFAGLKHRLQWVWQVGGVDCYDDLNSTTPQATIAAVQALARPVVLIAGGEDKGLDLTALGPALADRARAVILLPGPGSERLAMALRPQGLRVERRDRLEDAVRAGLAIAERGDALLLSPALPGFFSLHYRSDGREEGFRSLLRRLSAGRTPPSMKHPGEQP